jgi:hypothetical protein
MRVLNGPSGHSEALGSSGELSTERMKGPAVEAADAGENSSKVTDGIAPSSSAEPVGAGVSQPAGESSVSRESEEDFTMKERTTKPRSHSECTFTTYEALEGCLKDTLNETNLEVGAESVTKNGSASKKSSAPTSSDENEDESPSMLEHSDESAVSDDVVQREGGPPRVITTTTSSGRSLSPKSKNLLRRGKWTVEEEAYVARVIQDFNSGFLDAPAGTTLRTYLSEKLQCDPMRITKKFTGDSCIGKRVFHPAVRSPSNASAIDKAQVMWISCVGRCSIRHTMICVHSPTPYFSLILLIITDRSLQAELENLERRWRRRLEMQQRESAKKAAAAAVAVGRSLQDGSYDQTGKGSHRANVVTRTASWLDRANVLLSEQTSTDAESYIDEAVDIQVQMQEVQRLIHEGPIIQQTSAGLPEMIDQAEQEAIAIASAASSAAAEVEPADKRMRTAEDAEALVGFLRSVRASAASGADGF